MQAHNQACYRTVQKQYINRWFYILKEFWCCDRNQFDAIFIHNLFSSEYYLAIAIYNGILLFDIILFKSLPKSGIDSGSKAFLSGYWNIGVLFMLSSWVYIFGTLAFCFLFWLCHYFDFLRLEIEVTDLIRVTDLRFGLHPLTSSDIFFLLSFVAKLRFVPESPTLHRLTYPKGVHSFRYFPYENAIVFCSCIYPSRHF